MPDGHVVLRIFVVDKVGATTLTGHILPRTCWQPLYDPSLCLYDWSLCLHDRHYDSRMFLHAIMCGTVICVWLSHVCFATVEASSTALEVLAKCDDIDAKTSVLQVSAMDG